MAKCLKIFDHLIWKDPQLFLITQELTPQGQMKVSQSRQAYLRTDPPLNLVEKCF